MCKQTKQPQLKRAILRKLGMGLPFLPPSGKPLVRLGPQRLVSDLLPGRFDAGVDLCGNVSMIPTQTVKTKENDNVPHPTAESPHPGSPQSQSRTPST